MHTADAWLTNATNYPEQFLNPNLEIDLVRKIIDMGGDNSAHPYLCNLINNTVYVSTLREIIYRTSNNQLKAMAKLKIEDVDINDMFKSVTFPIIHSINDVRPPKDDDVIPLRLLMHHYTYGKQKFTDADINAFISICLDNPTDSFLSLMCMASSPYISVESLDFIANKALEPIVALAKFNKELRQTEFLTNVDLSNILLALESLYSGKYDKYFSKHFQFFATTRAPEYTYAFNPNVFSVHIKSSKDYYKIIDAFDVLLKENFATNENRIISSVKSLCNCIIKTYDDDNRNTSKSIRKWSNSYLVKCFCDLQEVLSTCSFETDYYNFVDKFGEQYIKMYEALATRIRNCDVWDIPNDLIAFMKIAPKH